MRSQHMNDNAHHMSIAWCTDMARCYARQVPSVLSWAMVYLRPSSLVLSSAIALADPSNVVGSHPSRVVSCFGDLHQISYRCRLVVVSREDRLLRQAQLLGVMFSGRGHDLIGASAFMIDRSGWQDHESVSACRRNAICDQKSHRQRFIVQRHRPPYQAASALP
jgi:hypothetical protein